MPIRSFSECLDDRRFRFRIKGDYGPTVLEFCSFLSARCFRCAFLRICWTVQILPNLAAPNPFFNPRNILFRKLETIPAPTQFLCHRQSRSASTKRIDNKITRVAGNTNDPSQELLGHLATMKSLTFLERSRNTREKPCIVRWCETGRWCILRTQNPSVVRQSPFRTGSAVGINKLSGGCNANRWVLTIESEVVWIFDEVKQMCMRTTESTHTVNTKGVIPDHPTTCMKPELLRKDL